MKGRGERWEIVEQLFANLHRSLGVRAVERTEPEFDSSPQSGRSIAPALGEGG